ncbi:hypothetical protein GCM10011492_06750 [Flexivirga endophytica]|uniref:Uncharacterized protein n=1 Tax=Flexivirga endophytica TaxID=1849103 RepID=A0A916WQ92_9MICO|nr:hypothetical protein [Flexivirga endophytica]GGB19551.1 hypothetical protein GCM10011492_06750 [Flexivirga endophytica]GHB36142.1 hypothetical protein GCM10008112_00860 [Flexivirga endophytica]
MSKPQRVHTFTTADLAMSDALGVQAKAICGRWVDLEPNIDAPGDGDPIGTSDNGCQRCAAAVRRLIRAAAHHGC